MLKTFLHSPEANNLKEEYKEYQRIPNLSNLLPYLELLDDKKTILTKNNSFVTILKIEGFDNISTSFEQIESLFQERKNMLGNLEEKIDITSFTIKRKSENNATEEENNYKEPNDLKSKKTNIINKIDNIHHQSLNQSFNIDLYLVINQKQKLFKGDNINYQTDLNKKLEVFNINIQRIINNLTTYKPLQLNNKPEEGYKLSRFLTYIINHNQYPVKLKSDINKFLVNKDIIFNKKEGIISLEDDLCQMINIVVSQDFSKEDLIKQILSLDIEFDIIQNIHKKEIELIKKDIHKKTTFLQKMSGNIPSDLKLSELEEAKELIENNNITPLEYSCYIKIFAKNQDDLRKNTLKLTTQFEKLGIFTIKETLNIKWSYLSCLSDFSATDARKVTITSDNVADFVPFFNSYRGLNKNSFGNQPVAQFKNISNQIFNFNFHAQEEKFSLGHSLIIGGTGAGKSTLLAYLIMNCLKYQDMKILAFDSKKGLKVPFTIFNGNYSDVSNANEVKLNPFSLEENLTNRRFLQKFISILSGGADLNEQASIEEVIRQNYDTLKAKGNLLNLEIAFGVKKLKSDGNPNIAKRIEKWIKDKDLKNYFNNNEDNLNFQKSINCFDMDAILDDKELLTPISYYIFHKFTDIIKNNPSPHIIFIDELSRYLDSDHFSSLIRKTLKESRKQNGIFIGAIQEASAISSSNKISKDEFLSNLATLIIFPNSRANQLDFKELGLNDNEFNFIKHSKNNRHVLIKQIGGRSTIIDTDLSVLGKYLKCFSSSAENCQIMEKLIANQSNPGNQPNQNNKDKYWLDHFLEKAL